MSDTEAQTPKAALEDASARSKEPTFEELKAQKVVRHFQSFPPITARATNRNPPNEQAQLNSRIQQLQERIDSTQGKLTAVTSTIKAPPQETIQKHISLLHAYNEIKDVGQHLLGLVADARNKRPEQTENNEPVVRIRDLMLEFGLQEGD